ncbi:hypothetical protein PS2_001422 [Malus domestica]
MVKNLRLTPPAPDMVGDQKSVAELESLALVGQLDGGHVAELKANKKKVGSGASHGSSSSSSSLRSLDHFFSLKDSTSSSSLSPSGFFGSIFPPVPSTGVGKERRQDFGDQASMYGSPSFSDNKGENKTSKASNMYQNEAVDPCNLSSSIYYGSQENYSPRIGTTESHQHHTSKKDGSKDDANSASRGNWWQGSLYY